MEVDEVHAARERLEKLVSLKRALDEDVHSAREELRAVIQKCTPTVFVVEHVTPTGVTYIQRATCDGSCLTAIFSSKEKAEAALAHEAHKKWAHLYHVVESTSQWCEACWFSLDQEMIYLKENNKRASE